MRRALGPQTTFCFRSSTRSRHFTACRASSTQADEPLTFAPFDLKEEGPRGGYANVWVVLAGSPPSTSRARVVIRADPTLKRHMKELTALRHDGERWYLLVQSQAEVEEVLQRVQVRRRRRVVIRRQAGGAFVAPTLLVTEALCCA